MFGFDDALDVFGVHGMGGITGNMLLAIFASKRVNPAGSGRIDGNYIQFVWQLVGTLVGFTWSFAMTYLILYVMNQIPRMHLRIQEDKELLGLDLAYRPIHLKQPLSISEIPTDFGLMEYRDSGCISSNYYNSSIALKIRDILHMPLFKRK